MSPLGGLSDLCSTAASPQHTEQREALEQLAHSALPSSFYVKSLSSLNCWPVCDCQGYSTIPSCISCPAPPEAFPEHTGCSA